MKKIFFVLIALLFLLLPFAALFAQSPDTAFVQAAADLYQPKANKGGVLISATAPLPLFRKADNKIQWVKSNLQGQVDNVNSVLTAKANIASVDTAKAAIRTEISNNINYVDTKLTNNYALKSEIGKDASTYFFVDRQFTGTRGGTSWTTQANKAIRASKAFPFTDIWQASDSAIAAIRRGEMSSAVVYVLSGNSFSFAEDTCTKYSVDYKIPIDTRRAVMFAGNLDTDSTSVRTSNLAYHNLTYYFDDNTSLKNYTASNSSISRFNVNYNTGSNIDSAKYFQILGKLNYESFYGQKEGKESQEIVCRSIGQSYEFNTFLSRRGRSNLTLVGYNNTFKAQRMQVRPTQHFFGSSNLDSSYIVQNIQIDNYYNGGKYTGDTTMDVSDYWESNIIQSAVNKQVFFTYKNIYTGTYNTLFSFTNDATAGQTSNSQFNISAENVFFTKSRYSITPSMTPTFLNFANVSRRNSFNINIKNYESEWVILTQGTQSDSVVLSINMDNAKIDGNSILSSLSVFDLSKFGSASTIVIKGNYTVKGYASIFNATSGSATIILDGNFKTLDDKPVVTVSNGFTGKLIINGKLIVGSQVTSPTSASISGTGTAIIQSCISNVAATATTTGNAISVNSNFKY